MWLDVLIPVAVMVLLGIALNGALPLRRRGPRVILSATLAFVLVSAGAWKLSRAPWQVMGQTLSRIETDEKVVALTFDDGPSLEWTGPVLAALQREGVRATFFLIGANVEEHPTEARAIVQAGHEVGNHTYSHKRMVAHSDAFIRSEVERTDAALRQVGYRGPILFRSPYCKKLLDLPLYLRRTGRVNVFWDIDADSKPDLAGDARRMAAHVIAQARGGSVILMHVMYDSRTPSRDALPLIVRGLRDKGFRFVTVSELMGKVRP